MDNFVIHGCEQVLRFTQVEHWGDLSEERKVQLGFNMGVISLGLKLTKEEGYLFLAAARSGKITMRDFRNHLELIIRSHDVKVDKANISKPF